ncbi:MAG: ribosome assembly RNA-binding protein YhbY [candidate division KSB1 bacterium]
MSETSLTGKQRRYLRGLGNQLQPVVWVGVKGVNEGVRTALENAFAHADVIKIKLQEGFSGDRHEVAEQLAHASKAELVQVLGKTILLYRRHAEKPKLELP